MLCRGNIVVQLYYRLFKNLETAITNPDKRKKHILENMIYMSELSTSSTDICRKNI